MKFTWVWLSSHGCDRVCMSMTNILGLDWGCSANVTGVLWDVTLHGFVGCPCIYCCALPPSLFLFPEPWFLMAFLWFMAAWPLFSDEQSHATSWSTSQLAVLLLLDWWASGLLSVLLTSRSCFQWPVGSVYMWCCLQWCPRLVFLPSCFPSMSIYVCFTTLLPFSLWLSSLPVCLAIC